MDSLIICETTETEVDILKIAKKELCVFQKVALIIEVFKTLSVQRKKKLLRELDLELLLDIDKMFEKKAPITQ